MITSRTDLAHAVDRGFTELHERGTDHIKILVAP